MEAEGIEDLRIEWIILADSAEVVAGKVYMLGGGWDRIPASRQDKDPRHFAVALSIVVPWNRTNERHQLAIELQDDDAKASIFKIEGQVVAGRSPEAVPGQVTRIPFAFKLSVPSLRAGTYAVIGSIDGRESERAVFHAHAVPTGPAMGPGSAQGRPPS